MVYCDLSAELPVDRLKIDFRSSIQISEEFADWLDKILEPNLSDRFISASEALNSLQPKQKPITESFSKKGIAMMLGLSITAIALFQGLDRNRYALLNRLGLTDYLFISIEQGIISPTTYLEKGGSLNTKDQRERTFLHHQVTQNNLEIIEKILNKKVKIDLRDWQGRTPLHLAKSIKVAELLLSSSADINAVDKKGKTALHLALENKNQEVAEFLIDNGINVNFKDYQCRSKC